MSADTVVVGKMQSRKCCGCQNPLERYINTNPTHESQPLT